MKTKLMTMILAAFAAMPLWPYTVENDPQTEFTVSSAGVYTGEVYTWSNTQSQRSYCTHIYHIRVPDGKRAVATLEYTHIDWKEGEQVNRGYVLSLYGTTIQNVVNKEKRIPDKVLYRDADAVIQGY